MFVGLRVHAESHNYCVIGDMDPIQHQPHDVEFIQAARVELNKVVWPTREETIQTTLVVLVVALFGGVFFWLLDLFLLWLTTRITGRGSF